MRTFYLILMFLSGGYLLLQLTVWLIFGRALFPQSGELFEHRKSRAEWQTVFPKNLLRLVVFVFVGSLTGALLELAGVVSWLSLPCAAVGGLAFNFLLSTAISPLYNKLHRQGRPTESELENMDAEVTEDITGDMYGEIRVRRGRQAYYFRAISANGRELPAGTPVIVIYSGDGACFVESREHFCDILFEEDGAPENPPQAADTEPLEDGGNEIWRA